MPKSIPLSKALTTHDGEIKSLELRDMTAADIVAARFPPYKMIEKRGSDDVHAEYNYQIIMELASRLSKVDDLLLGQLSAKDFHAVSTAVVALWNAAGE